MFYNLEKINRYIVKCHNNHIYYLFFPKNNDEYVIPFL